MGRSFVFLLVPILAGLFGCELDLDWDIDLACKNDCLSISDNLDHGDSLHTPYVVGTELDIEVVREKFRGPGGWKLASSNPDVLALVRTKMAYQNQGVFSFRALNRGVVDLMLIEVDGSVRWQKTVLVDEPTHLKVLPAGAGGASQIAACPWIIPEEWAQEPYDGKHYLVRVGSTATFAVYYYSGDTRLHGVGAFQLWKDSSSSVGAADELQVHKTWKSDWLQVTPGEPGSIILYLVVSNQLVHTLVVEGVEDDAIDRVYFIDTIVPFPDSRECCLLAAAFSQERQRILGAEFSWEVDGELEEETGDLFCCTHRMDAARSLKAMAGSASTQMEADIYEGYVARSEDLEYYDCSSVSVGSSFLPCFSMLCLLGFLAHRRRRRS